MPPGFVRQRTRRAIVILALGAGVVSAASISFATQTIPMTLGETVSAASAIGVVRVERTSTRWGDASERWMVTDCDLIVEDAILAAGDFQTGRTVSLPFWGGTIGEERQAIAGVPMPAPSDRFVVMLNATRSGFTPVVGLTAGLFTIRQQGGVDLVFEAEDQPLRATALALSRQFAAASGAQGFGDSSVPLSAFVGAIRANLETLRATPPPAWMTVRPAASTLPRRIPLVPASRAALPPAAAAPTVMTALPVNPDDATAPAGPSEPPAGDITPMPGDVTGVARYSYVNMLQVPAVINLLPRTAEFAPWAGEDEAVLARWNYYADIFRKYTTPSETYGWPDGVFDFGGFTTSADLQSMYGRPWETADGVAIGITFLRYSNPYIVEADVHLNGERSWTLNDEALYNGSTLAEGFRQTLMHEFGHVWGAQHNFYGMSTMNYMPGNYRAFGLPYGDDAEGIRDNYGGTARTDLGVYFYYPTGFRSIADAEHPAWVDAGRVLYVTRFFLENVGTSTVSAPTVEWYLTSARNFVATYYYLGSTTYPPLPRFTSFTPSTIGASLLVPYSVPAGDYYLAAFIRNDGGTTQGSFPFDNNRAFTRLPIHIYTVGPTISSNPRGGTIPIGTSTTLSVSAVGSTPLTYQWYVGPSGTISTPIAGSNSPFLTTLPVTAPTTFWVRVSNSAGAVNSTAATIKVFQPFIDMSLAPGITVIRLMHILELRTRIDALRARAGLAAFNWTDPTLAAGSSTIRAVHITELRDALAQAYGAGGRSAPSYSEPKVDIGMSMKASHIIELRAAVIALEVG